MKTCGVLLLVVWMFSANGYASTEALVTEAVVNAPIERVWDAFTTKAGIESWMVANTDIELTVGGRWRTTYRKGADLDGETAIHQVILSLDPGHMLSYRTVKSPKNFPFAAIIGQTWTVIYFDLLDANRTKVTIKMIGYSDTPDAQKMRAFFEVGNRATLDGLVRHFAAR
jgi:uncharacterized protein YndB with AHSA1/START domain